MNIDVRTIIAAGNVDTEVAAALAATVAIKAKTDNLPSDPADESLLEDAIALQATLAKQNRVVCVLPPFTSAPQASAVLPATGAAADVALPDVTVAGIPSGATIAFAYCFVLWRMTHNENAALNKTSGAQNLQVRADTPGAYATFCVVPDNSLFCGPGGTSPTGDNPGGLYRGELDVKATIVGNDTYNFKWASAGCDVADITLYDIQTGIVIAYSL